ncbi:daptide biosynthesis intramembrane metalloprotease [Streptomyces sp. NPDC029674]|uniref:daptide biosynthesis intramembrane metalloprotease n=1 Tax=Streptomyces sp. NPDC029674 TaxID=3365297 RepID=UPI00384CD7F7
MKPGGTLPARLRGRAAAPTPEERAALLARPRPAPDLQVHEPLKEGTPWLVQRGSQHYIRVGADIVRLLRSMDGARDHRALVKALGPPWRESDVARAVERLDRMKLLEDGARRHRGGSRFTYVPPLTFQFTVVRPERLLRRLTPQLGALAGRTGAGLALALSVGGALALALHAPDVSRALGEPLPLSHLIALTCASVATTALHELGHGVVLTHHGGKPSRMGVMLFYLMPAFFCDVSDGWRLPHRRQRVQVAAAGIATQMVIAGTAALTAWAAGGTGGVLDAWDTVLVFAVLTYTTGLLNLLPFVKLDGYIALMSRLDLPHLRDRTMTDARSFLAKALFGGTGYTRELPRLRWSVPFGLASMVFPLYLIALAASLWLGLIQGTGLIGATLILTGVCALGHRAWTGARRLTRQARDAGARTGRITVVWLLVAGAVAAAAAFVPVSYTITGGYVTKAGRTTLTLPATADRAALREGAKVTLERRGAVTHTDLATAHITTPTAQHGTAPLSAFVPVREGDTVPVPAYHVPLRVDTGEPDEVGTARVAAGNRPLGTWLYLNYIAPAWR